MPKQRQHELIQGTYFKWVLRTRDGVFFADGRSNPTPVGRHSLGTRDRAAALEALRQLDLTKAVEHGRADRRLLGEPSRSALDLGRGRDLYEAHVRRPRVAGGGRPKTAQRYKAVFDKFIPFARAGGLSSWNQVVRQTLEGYAAHLDEEGYAPRTEYLELTTLKQTLKWLVTEAHPPATCLFAMPLRKPDGTDTYCWKPAEVTAILTHCRAAADLQWMGDVFTALVTTGLRISELAALRWSDIDFATNVIRLTDESGGRRTEGRRRRQTKSGRGRTLPINADLKAVLDALTEAKDGLVFHGPRGGVLKPDTVRNVLIRDVLGPLSDRFPTPAGEVGFVDGRLHSCRHYFASQCAAEGLSEQTVMAWLGHRDSKMARHYFHLPNETAQRHMGRLRLLGDAGGAGAAGKKTEEMSGAPKKARRRRRDEVLAAG
ncbi:MAG TPA: site-specific integrase [Gemmataceae bacterium]|nr:site-specific integrase [Gemmataceae bacterium]